MKLYPLILTSNQVDKIRYYCEEQGYYLDTNEPDHIPRIYNGNKRLPLQLINGKIVAVDGNQTIDVYKLSNEVKMIDHYMSKHGNAKFLFADRDLRSTVIKGLSIERLEL